MSDVLKVSSNLRPNCTTWIVFAELHQRSKIISYCLLLFWLVNHKHFLTFIWCKWFSLFLYSFPHGISLISRIGEELTVHNYYEPSAPEPLFLKSKIFCVAKSQCHRTMKFTVVLMWSITLMFVFFWFHVFYEIIWCCKNVHGFLFPL